MPEHYLAKMLKETSEHFDGDFGNWGRIYRKGHIGVTEPFTFEERRELRKLAAAGPFKIGECYMNAQILAGLTDQRFRYIEGFTMVHGVLISHAWLEFNGKVFDPTLKSLKTWKDKQGIENREYYGMEVPKDLIPQNQLKMKTYSPLTEWPSPFAAQLLREDKDDVKNEKETKDAGEADTATSRPA